MVQASDVPSDEEIRAALAARIATLQPKAPKDLAGRGIVICAGGAQMFTNAYVLVFLLRRTLKSALPIEIWHFGEAEMSSAMRLLLARLDAETVDADAVLARHPARIRDGWQLKAYALIHSRFAEALLLDADQVPLADPAGLFDWPEYAAAGALFWPDMVDLRADNPVWALCGLAAEQRVSLESGQALVDKRRHWRALQIALYLNEEAETFYRLIYGDKDTFLLGWLMAGEPFAVMPHRPFRAEFGLIQRDREGAPLFQHRCMRKWRYGADHNPPIESFRMQAECEAALAHLEAAWAGRVFRSPTRSAAALALEVELAGALLRIEAPGEREERVRLLAEGDVGEGRTHDRRHWYCVERVGEGVALVFSNGERETAWLAREGHGGWHGRRMASPQAALHASLGEVAAEFEGERRTLVDDLLDASGFPHVDDDDLRAAFALLNKINPDVAERLRAIAATRQWPQKTKRRLEELAASLAVNVPRAEGPRRISIDFDVLGTRYVDPLEP